jgi:hypothetical protein
MRMRVFKTAWFSKAAVKARISDAELCAAIKRVELGQADDLGGGVFKKRLGGNNYRSIVLAKAGKFWVFAFLFAKKDRANINDYELVYFREVAALYREKAERELDAELKIGKIVEICHAN